MRVVVDVVELVELFFVLKDDFEDGVCLGEFVQNVESFGVEIKRLLHYLLSQDHHDEVLETTTDDHVANCCADELLEEPFLCLLVDEKLAWVLFLVSQLDPNNHIKHLIHILELVVGADLVDLV